MKTSAVLVPLVVAWVHRFHVRRSDSAWTVLEPVLVEELAEVESKIIIKKKNNKKRWRRPYEMISRM